MFGINYDGLKKKDTYDEIIDYIQNKQDKIKYPDRLAKQLRNSPQLSNLLDGNGDDYEEMNKQQVNHTKEIVKETIIREVAGENNETAQVLRAADRITSVANTLEARTKAALKPKMETKFSQTKNPAMRDSGSQAWKANVASSSTQSAPNVVSSGTQAEADTYEIGTQASGPQIVDMSADDYADDFSMQIDTAIADQERDNTEQVRQIIENHLGTIIEHATPYLETQPMEVNTQQKEQNQQMLNRKQNQKQVKGMKL